MSKRKSLKRSNAKRRNVETPETGKRQNPERLKPSKHPKHLNSEMRNAKTRNALEIRQAFGPSRVRSTDFQSQSNSSPSPTPPWAAPGARTKHSKMMGTPLFSVLVGKTMLRCKVPLRCQLEPNMTPAWPSLGPPEGPSDLYSTMCIFTSYVSYIYRLKMPYKPSWGPT